MPRRKMTSAEPGRHHDPRIFGRISRPLAERLAGMIEPNLGLILYQLVEDVELTIIVPTRPALEPIAAALSNQSEWPSVRLRRNQQGDIIGLERGSVPGDVALLLSDRRDLKLERQVITLLRSRRLTVTHILTVGGAPRLSALEL